MKYNAAIYHRRSIRLKGYDYSQSGVYFVTICVYNRKCLFGDICDGQMELNNAGRMVQIVWEEIPQYYQGIKSVQFQIMPNHIHGIIVIVGAGPCACPRACPRACPEPNMNKQSNGQPQGVAPTMSLGDIMHRFKTLTTKRYIDGVKQMKWNPFDGKLWQRNYYEHIIRDDKDMNRIREYILDNPANWENDENNPAVK